jgi:DNA-binding SARP family transcriptional activator/predicted ATPase
MITVEVRLFGAGQIRDAGKVIAVRSRKELAALAYLLLEGHQAQSREVLQALFWPDFDTESARNNLRVILARLQALVSAGTESAKWLHTNRSEVQRNPAVDLWLDVAEFQRLIDSTQRHAHASRGACAHCQPALEAAVALYTAEFLTGFALADCPAFEEWLFLQRERQHVVAVKAYQDLTTFADAQGDLDAALTYVQRQIAIDPLREAAYRQQMYILARQGERNLALAAFERCRRLISNELGIDPEPETLLLHQQILSDQIPPLAKPTTMLTTKQPEPQLVSPPSAPQPLSSPALAAHEAKPARHNLPQALTTFIGREAELAQLQERLASGESRLLSLVGPGGIGKTRLALQVAGANQQLFPDGVFFVALAGVQAVAAIPATILGAMGADLTGSASSTTQLLQFLGRQKLLLVIDNLEHLMEGVDLLLAILQAAPGVTLLVTTREQLNCQVEDSFALSGLATPTETTLTEAGHYAAVRLFCERAYRLDKHFKLTAENCPAVVSICQLVEGLPLAIELATTLLGAFDCAGLAAAIAQNQAILMTTQRDLPARHRSIQTVFDHSWQVLTPREQQILGQLALCQGRFSGQMAARYTGASLIDLTGLRYKSLLRIAEAGYYEFHPLLRSFALAKVDAATQRLAEAQVATLYLQLAAEQESVFYGATPQNALRTMEGEVDNLLQAWRWAERQEQTALLAQSVNAFGEYYAASGRSAEGEALFAPLTQHLLAQAQPMGDGSAILCLHLLHQRCRLLLMQSKLAEVLSLCPQFVTLAQRTGDRAFEARGLALWGGVLKEQGMMAASQQKFTEALTIARQCGQPRLLGDVLLEFGRALLDESTSSPAASYLCEALPLVRSQGYRTAEQRVLLYLGVNCIEDGDFQVGGGYLTEALRLLQLTGNRHQEARIVNALGYTEAMLGDYTAAVEHHAASRQISREIRQAVQESQALHNLCTVQRKMGNLDLAEEYGQEALRLALLDDNILENICFARLHLGYVWLARGDLEQAALAFQLARAGWQTLASDSRSQEATIGWAAALFHQGDVPQAAALLAPYVPSLLERAPYGVDEAGEMYLAAYAILTAQGDPRARPLLATAYTQLQRDASKITDQHLLRCFWAAPAHRQIRALWEQVAYR